MRALIKHIVGRAIAKVVNQVFEDNDASDIADAAAEKIANATRYDKRFASSVAEELDLDDIAEKVCENFEPDYQQLADYVAPADVATVLQSSVVEEVMQRLPTPLQALIGLADKDEEPEPETAVKPELVERLLDRAVEKLLTLAGEMAENGELHE